MSICKYFSENNDWSKCNNCKRPDIAGKIEEIIVRFWEKTGNRPTTLLLGRREFDEFYHCIDDDFVRQTIKENNSLKLQYKTNQGYIIEVEYRRKTSQLEVEN